MLDSPGKPPAFGGVKWNAQDSYYANNTPNAVCNLRSQSAIPERGVTRIQVIRIPLTKTRNMSSFVQRWGQKMVSESKTYRLFS
jgi:hypothetical protein